MSQSTPKTDSKSPKVEEGMFRFWENEEHLSGGLLGKCEYKWTTLEHNGVIMAPAYEPHNIPLQYGAELIQLTPEEEEMATMFASMRKFDYYRNPIFRNNFFEDWKKVLDGRLEGQAITSLALCNFDAIHDFEMDRREARRERSSEEKKREREANTIREEPYRFCVYDGRVEPLAAYKVEPPGLFRGRGKHPLMGRLKPRVKPEDIVINIGEEAEVPPPPAGSKWGAVVHNHGATWVACWKDALTGNTKMVFPGNTSSIKGCSDLRKYERARRLKDVIPAIRQAYRKDFDDPDRTVRQRAVCVYFIDKLALRVGGEKSADEADTVGCTSLKINNVSLRPPSSIHFDFLGKDSIRYLNTVEVLPRVYTLVEEFMKGKEMPACPTAPDGRNLVPEVFERINPSLLNDYLKTFMPELTAKVFRTYNASLCLDDELHDNPCAATLTVMEKLAYLNEANTKVAVLCNHQRTTVRADFDARVALMGYRVEFLESLLCRLHHLKELMRGGSKEGFDTAVEHWFAEEHRWQWDWLDKYGTEEEKETYRNDFSDESRKSIRRTPSGKKREGEVRGSSKKSDKSNTDEGKSTKKNTSQTKGNRKRSSKREEDEEDELTVADLKKRTKKNVKPAHASDAEDNITVGSLRKRKATISRDQNKIKSIDQDTALKDEEDDFSLADIRKGVREKKIKLEGGDASVKDETKLENETNEEDDFTLAQLRKKN